MQALEVNWIAGLETNIINEISGVCIEVLMDGIAALQDMAFGVGATAAEIGVGQQSQDGVGFEILVNIAELPLALALGRAVAEAKRVTRIIFVSRLILHVVNKYQRWTVKQAEAQVCKQLEFLVVVQVSIGIGILAVAEEVIVIT